MHARVLQSIWKLQRVNSVISKINYTAMCRGYATVNACKVHAAWEAPLKHAHIIQLSRNFVAQSAEKLSNSNPMSIEILLQNIDSNFQRNGNVGYEYFCKLMDALEQHPDAYNQLLNEEQALFLLSACGSLMPAQTNKQRMQLFARFWKYLEDNKQLTGIHFMTALKVRRENCTPLKDFKEFVEQVNDCGGDSINGATLYEQLIMTACESGNIRQATEILGEMRDKQYALTERVFNALIVGHARNRDLSGCKDVLDSMLAADIPLSNKTQAVLACAYIENEQSVLAMELLKKYQGKFKSSHILRILRAILMSDVVDTKIVEHLVRELPTDLLSGQEVTIPIRNICIELVHKGKWNKAAILINAYPKPSFNDNQDIDTFSIFLLHELYRAKVDTEQLIEFSKMLIDSGKNTRALHAVTEIAMRRSPPTALPFLEILAKQEPLRPHYFWPLIMYNFRRHGENGIIHTLKIMSKLNVQCDTETLLLYVLPRLSVTLENPEQALKLLDEAGLKISHIMTPILSHMLSQQKIEEVYTLTQLYPTKLDCLKMVKPLSSLAVNVRATKRYQSFVKVIQALANKSENPKIDFVGQVLLEILSHNSRLRNDDLAIHRLISEMHKFNLKISLTAAELVGKQIVSHKKDDVDWQATVIKTLNDMSNSQLLLPNAVDGSGGVSSSFIKHPRDMSLDELECHLVELNAKGMNIRGVLRRILQLCVRDSRLERALEVKQKCDELKVQISPGMLASIFDLYIKLKDLPNAELSLKKLQTSFPGFQIDEHKIIDYAALLVHEQQFEAGKRILSERAAAGKIVGGDYVIKNVWNFLTSVAVFAAKSDSPEQMSLTNDAFQFLQKLGYCKPHNALLGPLIREHLLRNDLHAAVETFKKLSEKYKHTPLQFELLTLLVRLSNSNELDEENNFAITVEEAKTLLTTVSGIISKVHGVVNMNSSLLLAFAESGTDQQLRRLLINPEFRINQEFLAKNCEHLGREGSVQTLLRLARCARGLNHVVSEQSIYNMLLKKFIDGNNHAAAVDLFERLEADDELKISQEFLRNLINLLKVNNVEIPSNVGLRAQIIS